jgi:hypothetical protein
VWLGAQRLVRGMRNEGGSYNCFLNVIIQALWHLRSFRQRMLQLPPAAAAAPAASNGPAAKQQGGAKGLQLVTAADCKVLQALRNVFQELANSPGLPAEQQQQQSASSSSQYLVSPQALREALSGLSELGAAAISIEHGEMHDASEVLNEMFTAMHRVEAGRATGIADDPHLPTKVKVRPELFAARKAGAAAAAQQQQQQVPGQQQQQQPVTLAHILSMQNGVSSNGPSVNGTPKAAGAAGMVQKQPLSMVHRLFGLDVVQADAAAAAGKPQGPGKKAGSAAAAAAGAGAAGAGAAAAGGVKDAGQVLVEAMQFMKFCHLMPAQVRGGGGEVTISSSLFIVYCMKPAISYCRDWQCM